MTNTTLYPFQRRGVKLIESFAGRCLLADEVGLGKTLQVLYWAWKYLPDDVPGPVVAVVPAHLKLNWQREARNHLGVRAEVLSGQRVPAGFDSDAQMFVINYDILCPPRWKPRTVPAADSWVVWLAARKPKLVICDEAHYLASYKTMRSRAVAYLMRDVPHRVMLTGTPFTSTPVGLWNVLRLIRPDLYSNFYEFVTRYTEARITPWGMDYSKARNLTELHTRLTRTVMIRRRKADVLEDLPPLTKSIVPISVDLSEYRKAEADFLTWLAKRDPAAARRAVMAEQLVRINRLRRLCGELKAQGVGDWITDFLESSDQKFLLGAVHKGVTREILKRVGKSGILVDGGMTAHQKTAAFDRFNSDPDCRVLVGNIQAAGTGWSCRSTSDLGLAELPWTPGEVIQFFGRSYGLKRGVEGQPTHARFFVAAGTMEESLAGLLDTKAAWQEQAIDGVADSSGLDIQAAVIRAIQQGSCL